MSGSQSTGKHSLGPKQHSFHSFLLLIRNWNTYGEMTSQSLWSRYAGYFVGMTRHNASSLMAKIYRVIQIKLTNEAYLSAITMTNIYKSFTYKMAAKLNWHRYGTKLRHCHPMYNKHYSWL